MKTITINNTKININSEVQISPSGRPFRLSGISKNLKIPEKWIDKVFKNHWIYMFIFLDNQGGFISFEFDYYNKYVGKI